MPWDRTCDIGGVLPAALMQPRARSTSSRTFPRPKRRRMIVLTAQIALLAAVVTAATAFVVAQKSVTVVVDGQRTTVHTFDGSVRAVLGKAHVRLAAHDTVTPDLTASVEDGGTVTVGIGRPIDLNLDGDTLQAWVTAGTVQGALEELGLVADGEYLSRPANEQIPRTGTSLVVRRPHTVSVIVDGVNRQIVTTDATVATVLATNNISLGSQDRLSVALGQYPTDGMTVTVTRVSSKQEVTSQPVAYTTQRVADDTLYVGTTKTVKAGQNGVLVSTYADTYTDGQLTDRVLTEQHVAADPQPAIVAYGTKPVPVSIDGLNWAALARCESGGNPQSVSSGGLYRGLYQFTLGTWSAMGGSGDPIDASPEEQTYRAQLLYQARGTSPWPSCGKLL